MEKYLITEKQFGELTDALKKKYDVTEVSMKKGELKKINIVKNRNSLLGGSMYSLHLEKYNDSYTLKFVNQNTQTYLLLMAAALILGITLVIPAILGVLLIIRYVKDSEFKRELQDEVDAVVSK